METVEAYKAGKPVNYRAATLVIKVINRLFKSAVFHSQEVLHSPTDRAIRGLFMHVSPIMSHSASFLVFSRVTSRSTLQWRRLSQTFFTPVKAAAIGSLSKIATPSL